MIRPTTIPQTLRMLLVEHAVAREALRLGLIHHKTIAVRLKGVRKAQRMIGEMMEYTLQDTYIDMMKINVIAGTGGLLSHAPNRGQTFLILADAWQPEGITKLYQDSVFMMPHLGVLSTAYPNVSWNIFDKDCLVRVGTIIAPVGTAKIGEKVADVKLTLPDGNILHKEMRYGDLEVIPLDERNTAEAEIRPARHFDVGLGEGRPIETVIEGGVVGVMFDARGRPLQLPDEPETRITLLKKWFNSMELYDKEIIENLGDLS
jgi:hypothetical protein